MITKNDIRLLILEIIQEMIDAPQYLYHVTPTKYIPYMKVHGITPKIPIEEPNAKPGVYLFHDKTEAEDAIMNWLGDKYREDEPLTILTINSYGLDIQDSNVAYEVVSYKTIPWNNVTEIQEV